jgi:transcriptional regulator with XRE-family HTH domain
MINNIIGKKIQELRIMRTGLSQEEFAKKIGKNRAYLSRVESGKQNLTIKTLQEILKEFDLSIKAFFIQLDEEE